MMLISSLILGCVICGSFAKYQCKAPYECMTVERCNERHGESTKKILFKCGKKLKCCPPAEKNSRTTAQPTKKELRSDYLNLMPNESCGQRPEYDRLLPLELLNKVYKGNKTSVGEIPWVVRVTAIGSNNGKNFCGGTLINENYVLTAAHCFPNHTVRVEVVLGAINLNAKPKCEDNICVPVNRGGKWIPHEDYAFTYRLNDIALIRLNEPVAFNKLIQPACLPLNRLDYSKMEKRNILLTAGWGATNSSMRQSKMLYGAQQTFYNLKECQKIYESLKQEIVAESHICALGEDKSRGLGGDSGGPLLSAQKISNHSAFVVIGVLSRGPNNFEDKDAAPVLYTKVEYYLDWILKHIKK